jgi:hypothetical protein
MDLKSGIFMESTTEKMARPENMLMEVKYGVFMVFSIEKMARLSNMLMEINLGTFTVRHIQKKTIGEWLNYKLCGKVCKKLK